MRLLLVSKPMFEKKRLSWILILCLGLLIANTAYCQSEPAILPQPAFEALIEDSLKNKTHYAAILSNGDDALLARLHLIRQAKKSILIQTFIWNIDETSRFISYELIQAAKRGVKVKIIIDYLTLPKRPDLIAFLTTAHPNLEVKLYNPVSGNIVPSKLALIRKLCLQFRTFNQRMHNKTLIIDEQVGITGGRNYKNEYYDRGLRRNFRDCDALVIGPAVKDMVESFYQYWSYPITVSSQDMGDIRRLIKQDKYTKYSSREDFAFNGLFKKLEACEADQACLAQRLIGITTKVARLEFVADKPGKKFHGRQRHSQATAELYRFLSEAKKSIVIQTPYLVIGPKGTRQFSKLVKNKPDLEFLISTNSLSATDNIGAYAFSYKNKRKYLRNFRWQIFEFKLKPRDLDLIITPLNKESRTKDYLTCLHSKIYVVDRKQVWIGSFNLDPRSVNLNTEAGVAIYDPGLAGAIEDELRRDMANQNSWTIGKRRQVSIISRFSGLLANIMRLVPIVDIWPFGYSGSFELKPGEKPVPFFDKDFYNRYNYIGPFPEMELTEKEIRTRLIKAFLGPIQPLI